MKKSSSLKSTNSFNKTLLLYPLYLTVGIEHKSMSQIILNYLQKWYKNRK